MLDDDGEENRVIQEKLIEVLDGLSKSVIVTDVQGRIVYVNRQVEKVTGYSRSEVIGRPPGLFNAEAEAESIQKEIMACLRCGEHWRGELWQRRKDGSTYPAEFEVFPVGEAGGAPCYWAGIEGDPVERKRDEEALRRLEQEKDIILSAISDLVVLHNTDMRIIWANQAAGESRHKTLGEIKGRVCYEIWHGRTSPCPGCPVKGTLQTGEPGEGVIGTPEGVIWLVRSYPVKDNEGNVVRVVEVAQDITARQKAQEKLRVRNEMLAELSQSIAQFLELPPLSAVSYQSIADSLLRLSGGIGAVVNRFDASTGEIVTEAVAGKPEIKARIEDVLGFSLDGRRWRSELQALTIMNNGRLTKLRGLHNLTHKSIPEGVCQEITRQWGLGDIYCISAVCQGQVMGCMSIILHHGQELQEPGLIEIFAREVAAVLLRQQVERQLWESRERYRSLVENARDVVIVFSPQGCFLEVNPAACEMLGYSQAELLTLEIEDLCHPADLDRCLRAFEALKQRGFGFAELTCKKKDGTSVIAAVNATALPDGNYLATARDITYRKQAEEALRRSEERFARVFAASPTGMVITSYPDGRIIDINDAYLRIIGYSRKEVIGRTTTELGIWVRPEDRTALIEALKCHGAVHNEETLFRRKDGREGSGIRSTHRIDLGGEPCILSSLTDITERKRMEREMLRLDRLNLVGETAAGIAHEIRNPMTAVRGFAQMLGEKEEFCRYQHCFQLIIDELDRANAIITEFLSLARSKPVSLTLRNLNDIINALLPLVRADAASRNITITTLLEDIPELPLDEEEIRQLILNLVRNGLDAMPDGRDLVLRTKVNGDEVLLAVQDHGCGMTPETLAKLSTPFFTTKDKGTGLGLVTCYSIARRHNAAITVETGSGGSTFTVRFKPPRR